MRSRGILLFQMSPANEASIGHGGIQAQEFCCGQSEGTVRRLRGDDAPRCPMGRYSRHNAQYRCPDYGSRKTHKRVHQPFPKL